MCFDPAQRGLQHALVLCRRGADGHAGYGGAVALILPRDFRHRQPELAFQVGKQRLDAAAFFLEGLTAWNAYIENTRSDVHTQILLLVGGRVKGHSV
jgi:hypothetical protein